MKRFRLVPLLLGIAVVASGPPAAAQPDAPAISAQDRREAKRLFNQAHLAYRRGDYEEAILKWIKSYELSNEPLIFESIANAYERLGDYKAALDYLSRWREKAPRREHEPLDTRIENLKKRVAEQEAKEKQIREEEARRKREQEQARQREEAYRQQLENKPSDEPSDDGPGVLEIVGWSLVGVGGAAVITGVILDGVAASRRPDVDAVCTQQNDRLLCREDDRADIQLSNNLAIAGDATWIAGLVVAAGGGGILLWQAFGGDAASESAGGARITGASPWVAPGAAGVGATGTF